MKALDRFDFRTHLLAYWLRPECAVWDAIAARRLAPLLRGKDRLAEIGVGNGNFSFLMLGGRLKPEFDWFLNTATTGFWENADIFDVDKKLPVDLFIEQKPVSRIKTALDHKRNLLNQAARLGFIDELIEHDCNLPIPPLAADVVYSNMLYWLNEPLSVMEAIGHELPQGGELVTVFPNTGFYRHCISYQSQHPLWRLVNRGRANHIMWHMDLAQFEVEIKRSGIFEIALAETYLSPLVLRTWDIGLRPLSVPLIKMANALTPEKRLEVKLEWCETVEKFAEPLLEMEEQTSSCAGGFNLVKLVRR